MSKIPHTEPMPTCTETFRPVTLEGFKSVTKGEFFSYIGRKDIVVSKKWSRYFSEFKNRNGDLVGCVFDRQTYKYGPGVYFLKKGLA